MVQSHPSPTPEPIAAKRSACVGIDAGATLCKVACSSDGQLVLARFPTEEIATVERYVAGLHPARVIATGGGAAGLGGLLAGVPVEHDLEFAAWTRGAACLAARAALVLPARYLLVSIGTGTSALAVDGERFSRAGGTALGGGALLGLSSLLQLGSDYGMLTQLASAGDRSQVDLLVGDIYGWQGAPIPPALNAASFGKLASRRPEDLAHALIGMIGENVALLCGALAVARGLDTLVYGGSTLASNASLRGILHGVAVASGQSALFLPDGGHCGAIGAALKPLERAAH